MDQEKGSQIAENLLNRPEQTSRTDKESFKRKYGDFMMGENYTSKGFGSRWGRGSDRPSAFNVWVRNAQPTIYGRQFNRESVNDEQEDKQAKQNK